MFVLVSKVSITRKSSKKKILFCGSKLKTQLNGKKLLSQILCFIDFGIERSLTPITLIEFVAA